jgi:hypothetical protein
MVSKRDERHEQDGETLHRAKRFRDTSASGDPAMALAPFGIGQTICPVMKPEDTVPWGFRQRRLMPTASHITRTFPRAN